MDVAQVVYPALDAKVKNVTLAYSVEHEDEVRCMPCQTCQSKVLADVW